MEAYLRSDEGERSPDSGRRPGVELKIYRKILQLFIARYSYIVIRIT